MGTVSKMVEIRSVELNPERTAAREQREQRLVSMTARERAKVLSRERAVLRSRQTQNAR